MKLILSITLLFLFSFSSAWALPECEGSPYKGDDLSKIKHWDNCEGVFTFSYKEPFEGEKYVGEFQDGKPHGQGTFIFPDGEKYLGKFKYGKRNGKGTQTWADGGKYVGEWKANKRHGQGTLTYADGRVYIGQFVDGLEHGDGTCFKKDGSSINCKMDISSTGRNTENISVLGKKWVKLSEFEKSVGKGKKTIDMLEIEFEKRAYELCLETKKFKILKKNIEIIEYDETPAIGLEPVVKLGIDAVIECK